MNDHRRANHGTWRAVISYVYARGHPICFSRSPPAASTHGLPTRPAVQSPNPTQPMPREQDSSSSDPHRPAAVAAATCPPSRSTPAGSRQAGRQSQTASQAGAHAQLTKGGRMCSARQQSRQGPHDTTCVRVRATHITNSTRIRYAHQQVPTKCAE